MSLFLLSSNEFLCSLFIFNTEVCCFTFNRMLYIFKFLLVTAKILIVYFIVYVFLVVDLLTDGGPPSVILVHPAIPDHHHVTDLDMILLLLNEGNIQGTGPILILLFFFCVYLHLFQHSVVVLAYTFCCGMCL